MIFPYEVNGCAIILLEDSPGITSLNRRIKVMSKDKEVDIDFESAATHDLVNYFDFSA